MEVGYYEGPEYKHQYLKQLRKEFPKSKHIPEVEYRLIDVYSLEDNVKALQDFLKKYPKDPIRWEANLLLAQVLDDLWEEYQRFSKQSPEANSGSRTKGSKEADKKEATRYKNLALEEYAKVLKNSEDKTIQKNVQTRMADLKNDKPDHAKYAEPD